MANYRPSSRRYRSLHPWLCRLLRRLHSGNQLQKVAFTDARRARADIAAGKQPKVTPTQAKPLVWTGHLLQSVSSRVKGGGVVLYDRAGYPL